LYYEIKEILDDKFDGKEVELRGWVHNKRSSGGLQFILLRDGTGSIQSTLKKDDVDEKIFEEAGKLTQESSISIKGIINKDTRAPNGYELKIKDLNIYQIADEFPIGKKDHGPDFLLTNRHLWIRSPRQAAILRIRDTVIRSGINFLHEKGFKLVTAPLLTPTCCEDTTTLFKTKYFGDKAYLSQSGQLYEEAAMTSLGKVFSFGPAFRAEKSRTVRHLAECWMIEPEAAFYHHEDNIKLQEELVERMVETVLKENKLDLEILERDISKLEKVKAPFVRMTYTEAIDFLQKNKFDIKWGEDLGAPQEKFISSKHDKPIIIEKYPAKIKAFYMQPDPEDDRLVLCDDMIAPEGYGEMIGGSERIWDEKLLSKKIKEIGIPENAYNWYEDLRKYGSVPHSGFGLGVERIVWWICNLEHIRECITFPRTLNRLNP